MSYLVLCTHEDFDAIEDVEVGFNEKFELVMRLSLTLYGWAGEHFDDPRCHIEAYLSRDESYRLSKRLKVPLAKLHGVVADAVDPELAKEIFPSQDDTWAAFRQMTDFVLRHGARYKIRYKDGHSNLFGSYNRWHD